MTSPQPIMATPFKRICCHAARSANSKALYKVTQLQPCEAKQWQTALPFSNFTPKQLHRRSYTTSRRLAQSQNEREAAMKLREMEDEVEPTDLVLDEAEISSTGHAELEQHREIREMMRTAAWEMPLLTQLVQPFERPNRKQLPLRWRYTTYMGDSHPASRKVVVEFNVNDLPDLTEEQRLKMKKLVGARLNPETNVVRMNCESFETQAQNKRYLGDTIQKLLAEVKDPNADSFADLPLDVRHHKVKKTLKFPEEWKLNPSRKDLLASQRETLLLEEGKRVENGQVVSGIAAIEAARQLKLKEAEEKPVLVESKKSSGQSKKQSR